MGRPQWCVGVRTCETLKMTSSSLSSMMVLLRTPSGTSITLRMATLTRWKMGVLY